MHIVIKISDEEYETIKNCKKSIHRTATLELLAHLIKTGTILPKGHGRLGDLDELEKDMKNGIMAGLLEEGYERYTRIFNVDDCVERVQWADTIIKADKEE